MEEQLVLRAKQGDDEAFSQLIEQHLKTVEKFAYQLGVHHMHVEDVTQEVFIKVYRFLNKHNRGKFTTWLYSITLNVVRDFYRSEQRQKRKTQALKQMAPESTYVEPFFDEESKVLHDFIQSLDEKYKIPIILHYFHDLPYQEIAEVLNVTEGAVKTRMLRAKKQLKGKFEKVGEQL
ncbi:RNA polymerase sigma factor [Halalkalibacter oceani]|uniref:RNA polymerase sigma factor n=1 Tax=Halalkalibacter oceani TaxID=1653776 RepID=A0A9X2DPK9_9BACI|nr:RNA polymerase sigma factor [Halalkalibacter oceani]MCM3713635.1 RNA polymerase sigma factor [Halalkalibacter oceani]